MTLTTKEEGATVVTQVVRAVILPKYPITPLDDNAWRMIDKTVELLRAAYKSGGSYSIHWRLAEAMKELAECLPTSQYSLDSSIKDWDDNILALYNERYPSIIGRVLFG